MENLPCSDAVRLNNQLLKYLWNMTGHAVPQWVPTPGSMITALNGMTHVCSHWSAQTERYQASQILLVPKLALGDAGTYR